MNNPLLDIICYPPHSIRPGMSGFTRYMDIIEYIIKSDCIHLEGKSIEQFKEGDICSKCTKGHLLSSQKIEDFISTRGDFRRKIFVWKCSNCGFEFKHYDIDTYAIPPGFLIPVYD